MNHRLRDTRAHRLFSHSSLLPGGFALKITRIMTAATIGLFGFAGTAQAAPTFSYSEDFTGSNGSFPTDWYDGTKSDPPDFTQPITEIRSNALYMERGFASNLDDAPPRNAAYNGPDSSMWQDYTVEVFWSEERQDSSRHTTGIIARWQGPSDPFNAYFAYERNGELVIGRGIGTDDKDNAAFVLGSASLSRAPANDEVTRLVFDLNGDTLTAEMFEEGSTAGVFDVSMGSVSVNDSTHSQGSAGVRAYFGGKGRDASFDDFSVEGTLVPEPGSLALVGLGGLLMLRRRSQQNAA